MSSSRVFYGWWVTVAFSVMVFVSAGVRHAVGPFLKPMATDLGVDRGSFSLVIALGLFLYGAFMPWIGGLTDRFGARRITAAGSVLLALSLVLTAYCQNLWQLALVYGVLAALGLACTGPVVANAVVTRWFVRRRGTAVSLLGSAAMTGMSLLVPVVAWLIVMFDWRTAYMVLGAAVLVGMLPLCVFVVRDSPEEMGMRPDGDALVPGAPASVITRTALRTVAFWQLGGSFFTCGFSMALVGGASYGIGWTYNRRFLSGVDLGGLSQPAATLLTALLLMVPVVLGWAALQPEGVAAVWSYDAPDPGTWFWLPLACVLVLGLVGTGFAYTLQFDVVRGAGPVIGSTITYLIPVVSVLLGVFVLGETLGPWQLLGFAIVLSAAFVVNRRPRPAAVVSAREGEPTVSAGR